jgi:hypothetical protein
MMFQSEDTKPEIVLALTAAPQNFPHLEIQLEDLISDPMEGSQDE